MEFSGDSSSNNSESNTCMNQIINSIEEPSTSILILNYENPLIIYLIEDILKFYQLHNITHHKHYYFFYIYKN